MRRALLCFAVLYAASPAVAGTIELWDIRAIVPGASGNHLFRFGVSETAYIEVTTFVGPYHWTAEDGQNVAALFAELTDGSNDPMTFLSPFLNETVDENHPFIALRTAPPLEGFSSWITRANTDLAGYQVDEIYVGFGLIGLDQAPTYRVTVWGELPEPSAMMLLGLGCAIIHVTVDSCRRRRSSNRR